MENLKKHYFNEAIKVNFINYEMTNVSQGNALRMKQHQLWDILAKNRLPEYNDEEI